MAETGLKFIRAGALEREAHPHAAGEGKELVGSQALGEAPIAGQHDGEQNVGIEFGGTQQAQFASTKSVVLPRRKQPNAKSLPRPKPGAPKAPLRIACTFKKREPPC
jgi:hypothetical protein